MGILLRSVAAVFCDAGCGEKLKEDAERMDEPSISSTEFALIFDEQVVPLNFCKVSCCYDDVVVTSTST